MRNYGSFPTMGNAGFIPSTATRGVKIKYEVRWSVLGHSIRVILRTGFECKVIGMHA